MLADSFIPGISETATDEEEQVRISNCFTPNYESDADKVSKLLAHTSGTTGALYFWLHSRAFACDNCIVVSVGFLAKTLEVSDSAVKTALGHLKKTGLARIKARQGNGGNTIIRLTNLRTPIRQPDASRPVKKAEVLPVNSPEAAYDKDNTIHKEENDISSSFELAEEVVSYLNDKAGKNFQAASKQTLALIATRRAEGYRLEDFTKVIDDKTEEWRGTEYEKYLRPATLFADGHFEDYLNQAPIISLANRSKNSCNEERNPFDGIF
ncbi:HTH domain-containing protein [Eggerthellaceae bacterium zg-887]|uniref:conserved phage C-terminal domain-containing protein n=1 Tax=Xiamenia xianingshaonis TaxID=2682776 RepID=UPI0013EBD95E|nr:conserved phage C-terminal domain-containing protein [Xiamenia xianingshaonis]NGM18034.1 HTH domain-containing protein [Eggerthellaceae bacterium zg-893]NHM16444.1 HTH domain-containing protein [Xiamenia xianingshaonis]